jgi:hypothetical protein
VSLQDAVRRQVIDGCFRLKLNHDEKERARIRKLHAADISIAEIARAYDVHPSVISRVLNPPEEKREYVKRPQPRPLGTPEYRGKMSEPKYEALLIAGWVSQRLMSRRAARKLIRISPEQSVQLDLLVAEGVYTEAEATAAREFRKECLRWFEEWLAWDEVKAFKIRGTRKTQKNGLTEKRLR